MLSRFKINGVNKTLESVKLPPSMRIEWRWVPGNSLILTLFHTSGSNVFEISRSVLGEEIDGAAIGATAVIDRAVVSCAELLHRTDLKDNLEISGGPSPLLVKPTTEPTSLTPIDAISFPRPDLLDEK